VRRNIKNTVLTACFAILAGLPLLQLTGCAGPSYYAQAISGHLKLMRAREEVSEVLASADTDDALAQDLALAAEVRKFAIEELGLPDNDSYRQLVRTGKDAVSWNVVAAPEFSVEPRKWCFLVSGCVAYRGYFDRAKAAGFAEKLKAGGYDVSLSPAIAYSTLGWFDDPLLDTMFQYSDTQLAAFLFHELAHQQLYVKGDTAFSEAYASFVEESGVEQWLLDRDERKQLEDWRRMQSAALRFDALLRETREKLREIYRSELDSQSMRARKTELLEHMKSDYRKLVEQEWEGQDYYHAWFSRGVNNASLALISSYQGGRCAFSSLYEQAGGDMVRFHLLASRKAALPKAERKSWLNRSCAAIASWGDL
jgi:predicted aminopeptidase